MLERKVLNLGVSDCLKRKLRERAARSGLTDPLPGILWGKWDDEVEEGYSIGFYERGEIPSDDPIRIVEADGIEFLITQDWICNELDGKVLDLDMVSGELIVIDS